jgi:hypothetical protein
MMQTERVERTIVALPGAQGVERPDVALAVPRGEAWQAFPEDVKDLAFGLWETFCGGDSAAVERLLREELPEGAPIPTRQSIARWARDEDWAAKREAGWRNVKGRTVFELKLAMLGNVVLAQKIKRNAMTGAYDDTPQVAAIRLKAAELADRLLERAVIGLAEPEPPDAGATDEDERNMTRAEREARIGERMAARRQARP